MPPKRPAAGTSTGTRASKRSKADAPPPSTPAPRTRRSRPESTAAGQADAEVSGVSVAEHTDDEGDHSNPDADDNYEPNGEQSDQEEDELLPSPPPTVAKKRKVNKPNNARAQKKKSQQEQEEEEQQQLAARDKAAKDMENFIAGEGAFPDVTDVKSAILLAAASVRVARSHATALADANRIAVARLSVEAAQLALQYADHKASRGAIEEIDSALQAVKDLKL